MPILQYNFFPVTYWPQMERGILFTPPEIKYKLEQYIQKEIEGGVYQFDKNISGLQLIPILFIYRVQRKSN